METGRSSKTDSELPRTEISYEPVRLTYEKIIEILDSGAHDFEIAMEINRISNEDHNRRSETFQKMDLNQWNFLWFAQELEALKNTVSQIDKRKRTLPLILTFVIGVVTGFLIGTI